MNKMALIVPSRGRPQNIERLNRALQDTESQVDLYVGVDPDDEKLEGYKDAAEKYGFNLVIAKRREKFGPTLNRIAKSVAKKYKYIAWMGDDHLPKTHKWDERYREALDTVTVGIVYGNDLVMGEAIATELAMTSNIVTTLGYAVPNGFVHLYIDNYFMDLARAIDSLIYLPDVIVQHMHPVAGNAKEDQTYIEANSPENWTNDRIRLEKYLVEELPTDVEKLRFVIDEKTER
jgi:hypothetical protein